MNTRPTVNSLSGGRTSSYLMVNYPADIEIFALVVSDCHNSNGRFTKDKKLVQMVNDKIAKHSFNKAEVVSTPEDVNTVRVIFDLEQMIGREIRWVRGESWEELMNRKKAVPNMAMRFCTFNLKILPIFEYLQYNQVGIVDMRIGYRYEESERIQSFTQYIDYVDSVNLFGSRRNKWKTKKWRNGVFPLVEDKIIYPTINGFWKERSTIVFPKDSNCQMCFWKDPQQLRKNFEVNPGTMMWGAIQEEIRGHRFKKHMSLLQTAKIGLQNEFVFGTGAGCRSGMCLD